MYLRAQIFEDSRGGSALFASLYLHGAGVEMSDPEAMLAKPRRLVDGGPRRPATSSMEMAFLELIAPDGTTAEEMEAALTDAVRVELAQRPLWVLRERIAVRFGQTSMLAGDRARQIDSLVAISLSRLQRRNKRTPLHLLRLEVRDFRGFDRLVVELSSKRTTTLVGTNGAGKTSLIDAIALLLSRLVSGITETSRKEDPLEDADVLNGQREAWISMTAIVDGEVVTWSLGHVVSGQGAPMRERVGAFALEQRVAKIHGDISRGDIHLPVIVLYPVNRAVLDIPLRIRTSHTFEPLQAYDGALAGHGRTFRLFFEWFRDREDIENESRVEDSTYRDPQLEAVRRAVETLLPGFTHLRVRRSPLGMVVNKGQGMLYVNQLSDGEKCLLAMVGDLARRLAMANPYLDDPLEGSGVVMIDEVELHLHPAWQRAVVPALERTFPNCQFLLTTHSPALLGHLDPESIFLLKQGSEGTTATNPSLSRGMDVNRVMLEIMGVDERPHDTKVRLEHIYDLLGAGKLADARAAIEALESEIGADPELTRAEAIRKRKEVLGR